MKEAIELGADLIFVWGGDGSVQRCIDAAVGAPVTLAILPAGTANLLANNLGIPIDLEQAVDVPRASSWYRSACGSQDVVLFRRNDACEMMM